MSNLNFLHSGGNKVTLSSPDNNPSSDITFKLPEADGSAGEVLRSDASGALSFGSEISPNMVNNGGMTISQRYGTSENTPSNNGHTLDQMRYDLSQSGKFKVQQVTDAPAGFSHSMKVTSLSSYTSGANDYFLLQTFIEGTDSARLGWGTSDAQTVTLSFYVKSSITGVHACGIRNQNYTRANTQTYTINNANTWERKVVTFTGDTSGTWLTSTNSGLKINFDLGSGSNFQAASTGTWLGTNDFITSNSVKVLETNGATWYITGIQLQVGDMPTPFQHRCFTEELTRCYRYYRRFGANGALPTPAPYNRFSIGYSPSSSDVRFPFQLDPPMRAKPVNSNFSKSGNFSIQPGSIGSYSLTCDDNSCSPNMMIAIMGSTSVSTGSGSAVSLHANNDTTAYIEIAAEMT